MRNLDGKRPAQGSAPSGSTDAGAQPVFRRVLVAIKDESQIEHAVELAQRAGASEARVLHLNLRESIGGRRYPLETESSAAGIVEAAVLELRLAGIPATGQVLPALFDRAAQAINGDAAQWGADLIVLGVPRRGRFASRLLGSVALRVQQHAPCPVLVASALADRPEHSATRVSARAGRMAAARSH
jgi:nucleotide-binding universal stress UspA family protein